MIHNASYRAHVLGYDPVRMSVRLLIGYPIGDRGAYVTTLGGPDGGLIEEVPEGTEAPSLSIPEPVAKALLDALVQYYGGSTSTQQLRADYDAERRRVDKLTDAVLTIATQPPEIQYREAGR